MKSIYTRLLLILLSAGLVCMAIYRYCIRCHVPEGAIKGSNTQNRYLYNKIFDTQEIVIYGNPTYYPGLVFAKITDKVVIREIIASSKINYFTRDGGAGVYPVILKFIDSKGDSFVVAYDGYKLFYDNPWHLFAYPNQRFRTVVNTYIPSYLRY